MCLSLTDAMYLIIHFFEDTIRTINDSYLKDSYQTSDLIRMVNIIDRNEIMCRLANYFRNIFRVVSAYIIVAFTLQRLFIVYKPLANNFKSKQLAWKTVFIILMVAFVSNTWTLFIFNINTNINKTHSYCDVRNTWYNDYLQINAIYIVIVMLIPISIIFISNTLIILKTIKDDIRRKKYRQQKKSKRSTQLSSITITSDERNRVIHNINKRLQLKQFNHCYSKKMTKTLVLVSFSFAVFNLPYLVSWYLFYTARSGKDDDLKNYSFSALQISEIFNILNYGSHFFVYCLSGTLFRNQLKLSLAKLILFRSRMVIV